MTLDARTISASLQQLCLLLSGNFAPGNIPGKDWPSLVAEAVRYDLGPYLLWAVDQSGTSLPAELDQQLRQLYRMAVTRSMILHKAQRDIARALDAAGIPHIWLKGIVLASTVYPDPALRPMVDLDVLVKPEQVTEALECLGDLGYQHATHLSLFDHAALAHSGQSHHHVLQGGPTRSVTLELHFALMNLRSRDFRRPEIEHWFRANTARYSTGGYEFTSLADVAQVLHLCEHMVLHHGLHDFTLTRPLDLHLLITRHALNWRTLVEDAVKLQWAYLVERGLLEAQTLFLTPIPPDVLEELRRHRPSEDAVRRIDAMAEPSALVEGYRWHLASLSRRERVKWAWRVIAPPSGYMRSRYEVPEGQLVWLYYLRRWNHQLREVFTWIGSKRGNHSH